MKQPLELVLATDLDGTFLEGDEATKFKFYRLVEKHRHKILLVYVTGRAKVDVRDLYACPQFPRADYVIGGVGAEIMKGHELEDFHPVQEEIDKLWQDRHRYVKELLANEAGLEYRAIYSPNRVAYTFESQCLKPHSLAKINDAGFDYITAYDRYLDVVPRGVNKGTSLKRLIDHLNIYSDHVITFGDSLNDLALFQVGFKSVMVSNCEPLLKEAVANHPHVYASVHQGVRGMIDGLKYYEKFIFEPEEMLLED